MTSPAEPRVAALFPGQGSQAVGMARALFDENAAARAVLERAFATLPGLEALMFDGPEDALRLTENAQPALVAAGVAAYAAWIDAGGARPACAAGHSLGEYAALVAADALDLEAALRLVRARGQYMQAAVPVGEGGMAAVLKLDVDAIRAVVDGIDGVEVANLNTPEQTIVSGATAAVTAASEALKARGARVIPLAVSAPFHSSLMAPARARLEPDLAATAFRDPAFPVVANVNALSYPGGVDAPALLAAQVTAPVRWVECVRRLVELGADVFVEFGSGAVLTGMIKRIVPGARAFSVATPADLVSVQEALS